MVVHDEGGQERKAPKPRRPQASHEVNAWELVYFYVHESASGSCPTLSPVFSKSSPSSSSLDGLLSLRPTHLLDSCSHGRFGCVISNFSTQNQKTIEPLRCGSAGCVRVPIYLLRRVLTMALLTSLAALKSQRIPSRAHIRPPLLLNESNGQRQPTFAFYLCINNVPTQKLPPNTLFVLFTALLADVDHWSALQTTRTHSFFVPMSGGV
ncbi:hypothetical protein K443DRAFT_594376 [Laccaria amethystina LaAM-08-1]|uniref:Uncharacterized protein n=1 Tax=Laccaria amethystina LaAM-08-1 TaxID=1095629 RepID=A0A0C9XY53_9AGAR|nr:hypothetical protein K443DRAFT_594376 [Laccaria amethystina LaAM-08-1]